MNDTSPINMFWWTPPTELGPRNFGDDISPHIVSFLSGRRIEYRAEKPKLLAVGSVVFKATAGDTIWGSGMMSEDDWNIPQTTDLTVCAVRGPLTRRRLLKAGIACPPVYGDPALLLPMLYPKQLTGERDWMVVPHIESIKDYAHMPERILDVRLPWKAFIDEIAKCRLVISASLHGIIAAEAYGVPAIWLACDQAHFKFNDYYLTTFRSFTPAKNIDEALAIEPRIAPTFDLAPLIDAFPYKATGGR